MAQRAWGFYRVLKETLVIEDSIHWLLSTPAILKWQLPAEVGMLPLIIVSCYLDFLSPTEAFRSVTVQWEYGEISQRSEHTWFLGRIQLVPRSIVQKRTWDKTQSKSKCCKTSIVWIIILRTGIAFECARTHYFPSAKQLVIENLSQNEGESGNKDVF